MIWLLRVHGNTHVHVLWQLSDLCAILWLFITLAVVNIFWCGKKEMIYLLEVCFCVSAHPLEQLECPLGTLVINNWRSASIYNSCALAQIGKEEVYFDHHSAPSTSATYCDRNQTSKFLGIEDKCWWLRALLNGLENIGGISEGKKIFKVID